MLGNVSQAVEITVPMIMMGHFDPSNETVRQMTLCCSAQMSLKSVAGAVIKRWTLFDCLKGSDGEDAIFFSFFFISGSALAQQKSFFL